MRHIYIYFSQPYWLKRVVVLGEDPPFVLGKNVFFSVHGNARFALKPGTENTMEQEEYLELQKRQIKPRDDEEILFQEPPSHIKALVEQSQGADGWVRMPIGWGEPCVS